MQPRKSMMYVWSGHSKCLFSCSLYISCLTSACFTYTLLRRVTFLHTCPMPQPMTVLALEQNIATLIAYQRDGENHVALLVSLVTDEPI